jgi:phytoene dehydrogenase-like protein
MLNACSEQMFRTPVQCRTKPALRLQTAGLSTVVLEAHGHVGGCAGYYRKRGFSFDVGATTLVDFAPGGVGGEFLERVGIGALDAQELPGYGAFLPDREVVLHRDQQAWHDERLRMLGDTAGGRPARYPVRPLPELDPGGRAAPGPAA